MAFEVPFFGIVLTKYYVDISSERIDEEIRFMVPVFKSNLGDNLLNTSK